MDIEPSNIAFIESTPQSLLTWVAGLQERFEGRKIALAVEQRRGPLIYFLSAFEFIDIYSLPTTALKRLREALYPSGSKPTSLTVASFLIP